MRVLIQKSDSKVIEMQSHAREGTLLANAVRAGALARDVEEREVTLEEYEAMLPPVRRLVPKSLILSRLTDEQLEAALAAMTTRQKERWRAPDRPAIYADDPEAIAVLQAAGADHETILA